LWEANPCSLPTQTIVFYGTLQKVLVKGSVQLLVKSHVLIYTADLLREENTVPWLIMAAEHSKHMHDGPTESARSVSRKYQSLVI